MAMTIAIDKLDKIGVAGVRKEMLEHGIPDIAADRVEALLRADTLEKLKPLLADSPTGLLGIAELEAAHSAAQRGGAAGLLRSAVAALLFGVAWAFAWYTPAYLVALAWANLRRGWVAGNTTPAAGEE